MNPCGAVRQDYCAYTEAYEIILTPKAGGKPMQDIGKFITIYERQPSGAWRMARDIWNSDNPQFIRR